MGRVLSADVIFVTFSCSKRSRRPGYGCSFCSFNLNTEVLSSEKFTERVGSNIYEIVLEMCPAVTSISLSVFVAFLSPPIMY
jgi:hypothetical protein